MFAAIAYDGDRVRDELGRADSRPRHVIVIGDERHATLKEG
jgi:hypothetical protein